MKYQIKEVTDFILKCFASSGQSPSIQDVDALIMLFCKEVETTWRRYVRVFNRGQENERWDLNEIFYFIELGLSKVFGDYYGINLITFKQFEHAYTKNENTHYRKQYLLKNPLPPQKELATYTESGKDDIVIDSIISKLKNNTAIESDYSVWYDYLVSKGIINKNSWKSYIYNQADDYEPAKERYLNELQKRKIFAETNGFKDLALDIIKQIKEAENDNPDVVEIEFWCKVLYFEDICSNKHKLEKLENCLKN